MESALKHLVPKIVPDATFSLHPHQGKPDLLRKLESRLLGYSRWGVPTLKICVVVDRDDDDCVQLKNSLVAAAASAGTSTLSRIAIEELEAWFFGDPEAMRMAYPRLPDNFENKAALREPDAIAGGTWEALERLLNRAGYYKGGMPKVEVASAVACHMDPDRNRSPSFQTFREGLRGCAASSR